jgi:hypothetical protein
MHSDPTPPQPIPHHVVWTWKVHPVEWLGPRFAPFEGAVLPYLVVGEQLQWIGEELAGGAGLDTWHLVRGIALAGGEGPIPGEYDEREAQRTALLLVAERLELTPERLLLDLAVELGRMLGRAARERVLRNARALGFRTSTTDCELVFALDERRIYLPAARALPLAREIAAIFGAVIMDDLTPRRRKRLRGIWYLVRDTLRRAEREREPVLDDEEDDERDGWAA